MIPPRSEKYKQKKKEQQRKQTRIWFTINLSLLAAIIALLSYFYSTEQISLGRDPAFSETPVLDNNDNASLENWDNKKRDDVDSANDLLEDNIHDDFDSARVNEGADSRGSNEDVKLGDLDSGEDSEMIRIHFGGDTMFSGSVASRLEQHGYDFPYEYIRERFVNDDLTVVNLETSVTEGGTPAPDKSYVFKSSPIALGPMREAGIDAVNLANNHTLDQGIDGLLDTMRHLKEAEIVYFGAGADSSEAYAPAYMDIKGAKVALFGFSRVIPEAHWAAGKQHPGLAVVYNPKAAVQAIKEASVHADLIIVVTHWGKERTTTLEKHQTELAQAFVDAGADLVIGGHPHVLQGIENYKGKWIAYSTGNFIFTKKAAAMDTWETAIFEANCTVEGDCSLQLHPYLTEVGRPIPLSEEKAQQVLRKVEALSPGVRIQQDGKVVVAGD